MKRVKITDLKLCVIGHKRHGKDSVCEIIQNKYRATFITSSQYCCDKFIYDAIKDQYGYTSKQQCFDDRHDKRDLWFNLINDYRQNDETKLATEILSEYNIYCGMRSIQELQATRHMFNHIIWVDASQRLDLESSDSMTISQDQADFVIDNNDVPEMLPFLVAEICNKLIANKTKRF
jgi:hypothetical protein